MAVIGATYGRASNSKSLNIISKPHSNVSTGPSANEESSPMQDRQETTYRPEA